jgi:hypothetical protein
VEWEKCTSSTFNNKKGKWCLNGVDSAGHYGVRGASTTSVRISIHNHDHWAVERKIIAGRIMGTHQIVTTEHELNDQTADWGLSAWEAKVKDTYRNEKYTWMYFHEGYKRTMNWILEKQD